MRASHIMLIGAVAVAGYMLGPQLRTSLLPLLGNFRGLSMRLDPGLSDAIDDRRGGGGGLTRTGGMGGGGFPGGFPGGIGGPDGGRGGGQGRPHGRWRDCIVGPSGRERCTAWQTGPEPEDR